jgi:hypothetical protein
VITKRQFLELIQDRLVGGPAKADERSNYPLPMISRMVDMILPSFLLQNPDAINDMCTSQEIVVPDGATSVSMATRHLMGTYSFAYAGDELGQVAVRDAGTDKALFRMNPRDKRVVVLGNARTLYVRFKPQGALSLLYVPLVSDMNDNDTIDLNGEGEVFAMICSAIRANDKYLNDKLNNDLVDPQNYDALRYSQNRQ